MRLYELSSKDIDALLPAIGLEITRLEGAVISCKKHTDTIEPKQLEGHLKHIARMEMKIVALKDLKTLFNDRRRKKDEPRTT